MATQQALPVTTPTVQLINGTPKTTSLDIAAHFKKRHDNVLRTIQTLDVPEDFSRLNFEGAEYTDEQGKNRPMYHITRDGFTILVMGFTGKQAMDWKIKYLQAFNLMETELHKQSQPVPAPVPKPLFGMIPDLPPAPVPKLLSGSVTDLPPVPTFPKNVTIGRQRQTELKEVMAQMAHAQGAPLFETILWKALAARFKIGYIDELPECLFADAVMFIRNFRLERCITDPNRPEPRRIPELARKYYSYPLSALYPGGEKNRAYQKSSLRIPFPELLGRYPTASQVGKLLDELTADGNNVEGAKREVNEVYSALRWLYDQSMALRRKLERLEEFGDKAPA